MKVSLVLAVFLILALAFSTIGIACGGGGGGSVDLSDGKTLAQWNPDGVIEENERETEYSHKLEFEGGILAVYWKNDDENLYMALKGETSGWMAIGFEPGDNTHVADMVFGWVKGGEATVVDVYSQGKEAHRADTELGGIDDILDYGGMEDNLYTVVEFKRKLYTGDQFDQALARGGSVEIIWALSNSDDSIKIHNVSLGKGKLKLD